MENIEYVRPQDIEKRSFAIISKELEEKGIVLPKEQELVTKRAIHTSADFDHDLFRPCGRDCKKTDTKWCRHCHRYKHGTCRRE